MFKNLVRRWIFILAILITNLVIASRSGIEFFSFFFWGLTCLLAVSILWTALQYFGTKVTLSRQAVAKIEEQDILSVTVSVTNNGLLPVLNLIINDYLACADVRERKKTAMVEYLGAGESFLIQYSCQCPSRGRYKIGPLGVYFFDPLGLFFLKRTYDVYAEVYVYPKTFEIQKFPALAKGAMPWFGIGTMRSSGDDEEFYGIRDYKDGDPIKRIHWLSTSRKNKLIVKEFQTLSFYRATIMFNLEKSKNFGQGSESVSEYTVKIAASVARHLLHNDVAVGIVAHAGQIMNIPFNKGAGHLDNILKFLAEAQAQSQIGFGEVLEEFSQFIPESSNLIVIISDQDWKYLPALLALRNRGIELVPLILVSSTFLLSGENKEFVKEAQGKLSRAYNFNPILFSCGRNPREAFLV